MIRNLIRNLAQIAYHLDEWLQNPGRADAYWASLELGADRPVPPVPVSLLTGWWDACLDEVLERYRQLRDSGTPARLVVGPWTHTSGFNQGLAVVLGEALSWLRAYTADAQPPTPVPHEDLPVRVRRHRSELVPMTGQPLLHMITARYPVEEHRLVGVGGRRQVVAVGGPDDLPDPGGAGGSIG